MNDSLLNTLVKISELWSAWMLAMSWQVAVLVLVLSVAGYFLRHRSARFRYALWTLAPLRLVLPPTLAFATGWGWWVLPQEVVMVPAPTAANHTAAVSLPGKAEVAALEQLANESDVAFDPLMFASPQGLPTKQGQADDAMLLHNSSPAIEMPEGSPDLSTGQRWQVALLLTWLVMVAGLLCRMAIGYWRVQAMVRTAPPAAPELEAALAECCRSLGTRRRVSIRTSERAWTPLLIGIWRPVIVLPPVVTANLSPAELHAVLVHELQHVLRHDCALHLVQSLLNIVYCFHPLVWLASRQISRLRELACDEATVAALQGARRDYSSSLIKVAETLVSPLPSGQLALGMAESNQQVIHRVRRILDPTLPIGTRLSWASLCGLILAALFLIPSGSRAPKVLATPPVKEQANTAPAKKPAGDDQPAKVKSQASVASPAADAAVENELPPGMEAITLRGRVVDEARQPVADTLVRYSKHASFEGDADGSVTTDSQGRFELPVVVHRDFMFGNFIQALSQDRRQLGVFRFSHESATKLEQDVEVTLKVARRIQLKVVNHEGALVAGARVAVQSQFPWFTIAETDTAGSVTLSTPADELIRSVVAWKDGKGLDYRSYLLPSTLPADPVIKSNEFPVSGEETLVLSGARPLTVKAMDDRGQPLAGVLVYPGGFAKDSQPDLNLAFFRMTFAVRTGEDGTATFAWLPKWQGRLVLWRSAPGFVQSHTIFDPAAGEDEVTMYSQRLVPIRGKIKLPDGQPANGIKVVAHGAGQNTESREVAVSNAKGQYEVLVPPNQIYLLTVEHDNWAAAPQTGFAVLANQPMEGKDFSLRPATRVFGRVLNEETDQPIAGKQVNVAQYGTNVFDTPGAFQLLNIQPNDHNIRPVAWQATTTDEAGEFEFFLGSGDYGIFCYGQDKMQSLKLDDEQRGVMVDLRLKIPRVLTGTVVTGDPPRPVAGVTIRGSGLSEQGGSWKVISDAEGNFQAEDLGERTFVHAISADETLGTISWLDANQGKVTLLLNPLAKVRGRLTSLGTSDPLANKDLRCDITLAEFNSGSRRYQLPKSFTTAADGSFEIDQLVPGTEYHLSVHADGRRDDIFRTMYPIVSFKPMDELMQLGDVSPNQYYQAQTPENRIKAVFARPGTPQERHAEASGLAKLLDQRLLIAFGEPSDDSIRTLIELRDNDEDFAVVKDEYRLVAVATDPDRKAAAVALAEQLGESLEGDRGRFLLVIFDEDGSKLATADAAALAADGKLSKTRLIDWLQAHQSPTLVARELLDAALKRAKDENKRVLIQETATWCGPCHALARFLGTNRAWEQDYIWVRMDHRWTGAEKLMQNLRKDAAGGIPWFAILNAEGKVMATSNHAETGDNIGFPQSPAEREHFKAMLTATRQRLTAEEITQLVNALP